MRKRALTFLTLCLLSVTLLISCTESNTNSDAITPNIPSVESMTFDLSDLDDSNQKAKAGSNFNAAIFRAGVAKFILDANLVIPKVLITAAQDRSPEEVAEGEYQWRYSAENGDNNFSVLLTAEVDDEDNVEWNFFVTTNATDPPLNNFLFFSGEADFDGSDGSWTYFDANEDEAVSKIEWDIDEDGSIDLEFSVLSDRNGNQGSEINFEFDGTIKTLVYIDGSNNTTTTIEYNTETKAGFIISPNYNNGEKSCWDESLEDITCTN